MGPIANLYKDRLRTARKGCQHRQPTTRSMYMLDVVLYLSRTPGADIALYARKVNDNVELLLLHLTSAFAD